MYNQFDTNHSYANHSAQLTQLESLVQQLVNQTQQASMQYQQLLAQEQQNARTLEQIAQKEQHAAHVIQTALQGHQTAIQQLHQINSLAHQLSVSVPSPAASFASSSTGYTSPIQSNSSIGGHETGVSNTFKNNNVGSSIGSTLSSNSINNNTVSTNTLNNNTLNNNHLGSSSFNSFNSSTINPSNIANSNNGSLHTSPVANNSFSSNVGKFSSSLPSSNSLHISNSSMN